MPRSPDTVPPPSSPAEAVDLRLTAALDYAGRGWHVIPLHHVNDDDGRCSCRKSDCTSVGKHPRTKHGVKDGTTDPTIIRDWWTRWPNSNIGIVTGPSSKLWVLDLDGDQGLNDWDELCGEHGQSLDLLGTPLVQTGSGGAHYYFKWPDDGLPLTNRGKHRETKIDVRGDGGYVVAPPSRNANGGYTWHFEGEPLDAPQWLIEWVRTSTPKVDATEADPVVIKRARAYLATCDPAVTGQCGHSQTFNAARALCWGFDLSEKVSYDLLKSDYNPRCTPPWSATELRHKVREAATKPYGKPRGHLLNDDARNSRDFRDGFRQKGWAPPAPLPTMPPVPPFPLSVFPAKVADYWRAAGEALSCPVDYVAVPGMTALGAAIGRSRAAQVKPGYAESPLFWTAVFAPPGSKKSPALRVSCAPLQRAEGGWLDRYREAAQRFDTDSERYNADVKEWKNAGCQGEPPTKPRKPPLRQIILDDTTAEATAKVLAENPRGIAVIKDELIGFVRSLNQYKGGKGGDREFWQSAWAGAPAKVNRSKDHDTGPLVIPHPFVAFAGMMCPDALGELRGDNRNGDAQADGFLDRFLLSFPDPMDATAETWRVIPEDVTHGYADVFTKLLNVETVPESVEAGHARSRPNYVTFSIGGRAAWEEFTGTMAARMNALDKFDPFRGVLSKLEGYGARFAALLWSLRLACGDKKPTDLISTDTICGATALVDYFERHATRCLGRGWADRSIRVATRLLGWLSRNPQFTHFNRTDAFINLKDKRDVKSAESLASAFRILVDHGYLRPFDHTSHSKSGPIPETYLVNPLWVRSPPE